jgi:hypothetical protein
MGSIFLFIQLSFRHFFEIGVQVDRSRFVRPKTLVGVRGRNFGVEFGDTLEVKLEGLGVGRPSGPSMMGILIGVSLICSSFSS